MYLITANSFYPKSQQCIHDLIDLGLNILD